MKKDNDRKCWKCGSKKNVLYRFPKPGVKNAIRCEMWAKWMFPDGPWSSTELQNKLYSEHRMLCDKHFKKTSFIDYAKKKLHRHGFPELEFDVSSVTTLEYSNDKSISNLQCTDGWRENSEEFGKYPSYETNDTEKPNDSQNEEEIVQSASQENDNTVELDDENYAEEGESDIIYEINDNDDPRKSDEETLGEERELEYQCNVCEKKITGARYCCIQCSDYDMCAECEASGKHALHYVLRIPNNKSQREVVAVIERLRAELRDGNVIWTTGLHDELSVKEEIVEKLEEHSDPLTGIDSEVPCQEKTASDQEETKSCQDSQVPLDCIPVMNKKMVDTYDSEEQEENDYKDVEYLEDIVPDMEADQIESEQMVSVSVSRPRRRINILRRTLKHRTVGPIQSGPRKTDVPTMRRPQPLKRTIQSASVNNENLKRLKSCSSVPSSDVENKPTVRIYTKDIVYNLMNATTKQVIRPINVLTIPIQTTDSTVPCSMIFNENVNISDVDGSSHSRDSVSYKGKKYIQVEQPTRRS